MGCVVDLGPTDVASGLFFGMPVMLLSAPSPTPPDDCIRLAVGDFGRLAEMRFRGRLGGGLGTFPSFFSSHSLCMSRLFLNRSVPCTTTICLDCEGVSGLQYLLSRYQSVGLGLYATFRELLK